MEFRTLTEVETKICKNNLRSLDLRFRACIKKCANPECKYPLSALEEHNFSTWFNGKVCDLCHFLEQNIYQYPGLRAAHDEWKAEIDKKKKMIDGKNFF